MNDKLREFRREKGWTQQELADALGVSRSLVAMVESGKSEIGAKVMVTLRSLGFEVREVGDPLIPASQLLVPLPYIGYIAASDPVNWTDPFESETFEYVPPEMGDARGRFACRISSDSMYPLLEPQDVCVFQRTDIPRIGQVILFRSDEGLVTVKQLKHDGFRFMLIPLNSRYDAFPAEGSMLGYLVGIVRERGTQRITIYDSSGITP